MSRRGNGFEDFIHALRATWGPDPVGYDGRFYRIPPSEVGPEPLQEGGPAILLAALPGAEAPTRRAGTPWCSSRMGTPHYPQWS